MHPLRFGLSRFAQSATDWKDHAQSVEECGFDVLWAPDHLFHFQPDQPMLDGWMTLAAWAAVTERIRLGVLVTNLSWRSPVLIARAAVALDQISSGRFELGLGVGAFADQAMANVLELSSAERLARLDEGVRVIDRLLRGDASPFSGYFTTYTSASLAPGCVQHPRLPITIGANGDRALQVAARHADSWNTWGGSEIPIGEFFAASESRTRRLDQYCNDVGRDPSTLRRSLLVYRRFIDPWAERGVAEDLVERFAAIGFTEFVFNWPSDDQWSVFEHFAQEVMPGMRTGGFGDCSGRSL